MVLSSIHLNINEKKPRNIVYSSLYLTSGLYFFRFYFLREPDFTLDQSRSASTMDHRPVIIVKRRQMVKDVSNRLYKLSVESVKADILASRLTATNAIFSVDSFFEKNEL